MGDAVLGVKWRSIDRPEPTEHVPQRRLLLGAARRPEIGQAVVVAVVAVEGREYGVAPQDAFPVLRSELTQLSVTHRSVFDESSQAAAVGCVTPPAGRGPRVGRRPRSGCW